MRPSFNAFIEAIKSNKIPVILIFFFNTIQAICENSLIIFTFYLLTFVQNGEINKSEISFPIGENFHSFLGQSEMLFNINFILIMMVSISLLQGLCQYLGKLNSEVIGSWLREKINHDISRVLLDGDYEKISKIKSGKLLTISAECPEALRLQIQSLTLHNYTLVFICLLKSSLAIII